ncbi:MAG: hypothetical protein HC800_20740, partial [Phormidesmis sp. RL_2_1]|nr:hypothetical protein [Phormidesmis sp. RL_2_1]
SISHLFSAAAFRMGHTQSFNEFLLIGDDGQALPSVSLNQSTFNPGLVKQYGIDAIFRGLFAQPSQAIDTKVIDQLRNTLFGPPGSGGIDLAAVDIQRGRDVGLPDYNQARIDFGLAPVTTFSEITSDPNLQALLKQVYGNVNDIDAMVGGLAEDPASGSMVGEFFQKVIVDQFERLRDGDRFWYENGQFTAEELSFIRGTSLSALLARNTKMTGLADNLFATGRSSLALTTGGTVASQSVNEYASIDGSNNNLNQPKLGKAGTNLRVDYTQEYGDGIRSFAGEDRANVRDISNVIFAQDESIPDPTGATGFMLAWSQFIGHDSTFAPPGAADTIKFYGTQYEAATGEKFPFVAERINLLLDREVYAGVNNVIERPIYLPALAISDNVQTVDADGDLTVTNAALGAQVFTEATSLKDNRGMPFTGQLTISEVPPELTPAVLPENLYPDLVVTIQPGEMIFTTPARLTLPNTTDIKAGTQMDLWSINPITGNFEIVGVGRVSADGERIETIDGGIRNSSWHFFVDRPLAWTLGYLDQECESCIADEDLTSTVELYSGAVIETHNLPTYQSLGETRGVQLVYDSLRADARPVFDIGIDSSSRANTLNPDQLLLTADLKIYVDGVEYSLPGFSSGELQPTDIPFLGADGKNFWRLPEEFGPLSAKLQADMRQFETGIYSFSMTAGIQSAAPGTVRVVVKESDGSETTTFKSVVRLSGRVSSPTNGDNKLVHINSVNSAFGSGWGIAGVQKIVEGYNGAALLIDGDGSERVFEAPTQKGEAYKSPPGHFSTLKKLENGTFHLIDKQRTVYSFDGENNLISVVDRNGNTTRHLYADGRLVKIIDPAQLETTFTYNDEGRVSQIIDPAGRTTRLIYDAGGNLAQVLDPDSSKRTFEYDRSHHMTAEVDKNNRREEATYDFAGRVTSATRKDGSTLEVKPIQTQGLYRPEATAARYTQAIASLQSQLGNTSRYVDGNGNVKTSLLDQAGQIISTTDEEGQLSNIIKRNESNEIIKTTDANGFTTRYRYDDYGNLIKTSDSLSGDGISKSEIYSPLGDLWISDIELQDINNDGVSDIVAAYEKGFVVLFNQGDRTLSAPTIYDLDISAQKLIVEDVNNDGNLDVSLLYQDPNGFYDDKK